MNCLYLGDKWSCSLLFAGKLFYHTGGVPGCFRAAAGRQGLAVLREMPGTPYLPGDQRRGQLLDAGAWLDRPLRASGGKPSIEM